MKSGVVVVVTLSKMACAGFPKLPAAPEIPMRTEFAIAIEVAEPTCVQFTPSGETNARNVLLWRLILSQYGALIAGL